MPSPGQEPPKSPLTSDDEWDAGDMGCGELLMLLRPRIQSLRPGAVLRLVARDAGAPEDLPSWCRLTGHNLIAAHHPEYWIQRKES
ncbi:MAG TPA: sulfurtransferase TusA family protein [Terriglobia bacterium]